MKNKILILLGLLLPVFFVFYPLFSTTQIVAGDAPYFSSTELSELVSEPFAWTERGENMGGVDPRLFISPLLVVYGFMGSIGLSNEVIIRLLFYFPSLVLSLIGPAILAKHFKQSRLVQFFASYLYVINSYYILLIDGGQVGIALAYGIFPIALLAMIKFLQKPTIKEFVISLLVVQALIISDPRIAGIAFLFIAFGLGLKLFQRQFRLTKKHGKYLIGFGVSLIGINAYWLYPLIAISGTSMSTQTLELQFLSLLNAFTLYQPHWPSNVFGDVLQPAWYFVGFAFLIFGGFIFKTKSKVYLSGLVMFLVFAFLLKGDNAPLGGLYSFATNRIPMGSAFRDSSKFFIPLMLLAGVLVGISLERLQKMTKASATKTLLLFGVYAYVLAVLLPGMTQGHNFVLSGDTRDGNLKDVNEILENDAGFSRSAWFPERAPDTFETYEKPALDAKGLADYYPLANLTAGSSDRFNYIYHGDEFIDWYRVLGIEHVVLSGDRRNPFPSNEEQDEWNRLITRMDTLPQLERIEETGLPVYKIYNSYPRMYGVDQIALIVGPMLENASQTYPAVYFENEKLDYKNLEGLDPDSATIVFNHTDRDDFTMSFLQDYFVGTSESSNNKWAEYSSDEYLVWKYQLLIREIRASEFDYGRGVSLSDHSGEALSFNFDISEDSDYVLAIRHLQTDSKIGYKIENHSGEIISECLDYYAGENYPESKDCVATFSWYTEGMSLSKGEVELTITNEVGVSVINSVALIPVSEWNDAQEKSQVFIDHFGTSNISELLREFDRYEIETDRLNRTMYDITSIPEEVNWIVLSENYHDQWRLKRGINEFGSVPLYTMLNAFYVEPEWRDVSIYFKGQNAVRWGMWGTAVSALLITILSLWYWPAKKND